jgi:hypothetical protein
MKRIMVIPYLIGVILLTSNPGFPKKSEADEKLTQKNAMSELSTEKKIEVDIELSMADLTLSKASGDQAYTIDIDYDEEHFMPLVSYKVRGDYGVLKLSMDYDEQVSDYKELDDLFKGVISHDHDKDNAKYNKWNVLLSDHVPLEISAELAMGSGDLDLTDLQIDDLKLEAGLSDLTVRFDKPNPIAMDRFAAEVGLGSFELIKMGNASVKKLSIEVGLGSATIDMSGPINPKMSAQLDVGLGSLELLIPKGLPVKINCDCSFLSSVDFDDFRKQGESTYLSPGFDENKDYITLNISVGLGSAKVEWIE